MTWKLKLRRSTGWHDLTTLADAPLTQGRILWQAHAGTGWIYLENLRTTELADVDLFAAAGAIASVAPSRDVSGVVMLGNATPRRARLTANAMLRLYQHDGTSVINGTIDYPFERAMPVTFPGVKL